MREIETCHSIPGGTVFIAKHGVALLWRHASVIATMMLLGPMMVALPVASADDDLTAQYVNPTATGVGISHARKDEYHYVVEPSDASARSKAAVFVILGGGTSRPSDYVDISNEAARMGYAGIALDHPNAVLVSITCGGNDSCYTQNRGERVFGERTAYGPSSPTYDYPSVSVPVEDSIIGRLLSLFDYLATQPANAGNPDPSYWEQFIVVDNASPYITSHHGKAYPAWSKIIVAGHSEGAGHAAFLSSHLPVPVKRVLLFSGPDDSVNGESASWIADRSVSAQSNYWGLRHVRESIYGGHVTSNWKTLTGAGGLGGDDETDIDVGDGTADPRGHHRLVISQPDRSTLVNHSQTAARRFGGPGLPEHEVIWDYMLTGGYAD